MFAFQSAGSVWSPTRSSCVSTPSVSVSIHGLRVEPDWSLCAPMWIDCNFNPRAPYGARHLRRSRDVGKRAFQSTGSVWSPTSSTTMILYFFEFQSTGSVWSPTSRFPNSHNQSPISIHGLRVEPDCLTLLFRLRLGYFNPRAPCGARR